MSRPFASPAGVTPEQIDRAVGEATTLLKPKAKPRTAISAAERIEIANLYLEGKGIKWIAWKVNRSSNAVRKVVYDGKDPWLTKRNARLIELWNAGMTSVEVGAELTMNASAVLSMVYLLRRRGVELKRRGRWDAR